jgi:hypothetical protein
MGSKTRFPLELNLNAVYEGTHQARQEKNQEKEEYDPRESRGSNRDSGESKNRSNQSDNEEHHCPVKHISSLLLSPDIPDALEGVPMRPPALIRSVLWIAPYPLYRNSYSHNRVILESPGKAVKVAPKLPA